MGFLLYRMTIQSEGGAGFLRLRGEVSLSVELQVWVFWPADGVASTVRNIGRNAAFIADSVLSSVHRLSWADTSRMSMGSGSDSLCSVSCPSRWMSFVPGRRPGHLPPGMHKKEARPTSGLGVYLLGASPASRSPPRSVPVPARPWFTAPRPLGGSRDAGGLGTPKNPLYILSMKKQSPLLSSLSCAAVFWYSISIFIPYIHKGKALKNGKPRARARGRSLRRRAEMVSNQAPLEVSCGLPSGLSLRSL